MPTDAEAKMWYHLRAKRLCGVKFKRQVPMGAYIVDFVAKEMNLIIEIDGGQHNEETDIECTRYLEKQGFKVLRFWNNDVLMNIEAVLESIRLSLMRTNNPSPPAPLPQAGEGVNGVYFEQRYVMIRAVTEIERSFE